MRNYSPGKPQGEHSVSDISLEVTTIDEVMLVQRITTLKMYLAPAAAGLLTPKRNFLRCLVNETKFTYPLFTFSYTLYFNKCLQANKF